MPLSIGAALIDQGQRVIKRLKEHTESDVRLNKLRAQKVALDNKEDLEVRKMKSNLLNNKDLHKQQAKEELEKIKRDEEKMKVMRVEQAKIDCESAKQKAAIMIKQAERNITDTETEAATRCANTIQTAEQKYERFIKSLENIKEMVILEEETIHQKYADMKMELQDEIDQLDAIKKAEEKVTQMDKEVYDDLKHMAHNRFVPPK